MCNWRNTMKLNLYKFNSFIFFIVLGCLSFIAPLTMATLNLNTAWGEDQSVIARCISIGETPTFFTVINRGMNHRVVQVRGASRNDHFTMDVTVAERITHDFWEYRGLGQFDGQFLLKILPGEEGLFTGHLKERFLSNDPLKCQFNTSDEN